MSEADVLAAAVRRAAPEPDAEAALGAVRARHRRRVRRTRLVTAGIGAVVIVGATVGAFALDRGRPDPEAPPTTDAIDVEVTAPDPGVAVGRHPVRVTPSAGLVEGQEVTVSGRRFPPGEGLAVTMCLSGAVDGGGVAACDAGLADTAVGSDGDGRFETTYVVHRRITVGTQLAPVDCATVEGGCIVAVSVFDDYARSGGMAVAFDAASRLPPLLTASITPDDHLLEGDEVRVEVADLAPRDYVNVNQCVVIDEGRRLGGCERLRVRRDLRADRLGSVSFAVTVYRTLEPFSATPTIDCVEVSCMLVVSGSTARTTVPLAFDPDAPDPPPVVVTTDPTDDLADGDRVEVMATGLRPGVDLIVNLCPTEAAEEDVPSCLGEQLGYEPADATGAAALTVTVPARIGWYPNDVALQPADGSAIPIDCTARPGRCEMVIHTFYRVRDRVPITFG